MTAQQKMDFLAMRIFYLNNKIVLIRAYLACFSIGGGGYFIASTIIPHADQLLKSTLMLPRKRQIVSMRTDL